MACNPSKKHMELYKIGEKFIKDPIVNNTFKNPSDLVLKKYIQLFGFKPSEFRAFEPTNSDIRKFKGELKHVFKQIKKGKIIGNLGSNLYTTSAVARRNPELARLYDEFLKINYELKGRQGYDIEKFNSMMTLLAEASTFEGMLPNTKSITKAQKLATKYQQEIEALRIDSNNGLDVGKKLAQAEGRLDKFLSEGEGKVFKNFIEKIESKTTGIRSLPEVVELMSEKNIGKQITTAQLKKIKDAIFKSEMATTPKMGEALLQYVELMHTAYNTLSKGVEAYVGAVKEGMMAKGVTNLEKLNQVELKLKEKLLPDEKAGYYPHFRYDLNTEFLDGLMPKLEKMSIESSFGTEMRKSIGKAVDSVDLFDVAMSDINTYLSKRIAPRTKNLDNKLYSMNFPVTIKRYLDEINRFNFMAHTQRITRQVLNDASRQFKKGKDLEGYGRQFVEMVMDLHNAQTGIREVKSGEWNNLSRALLNLEFTSKLGLNLRSGVVNSTQYLLNLVEFGPTMMKKSKNWYESDPKLKNYVEESMRESGLRFATDNPELLDLQSSKAFKQNVRLNDGNQIEFVKPSKLSQFADLTGQLAGKSGVFMRVAENFNRESTYKLGFYKMWTQLASNAKYKQMEMNKRGGKLSVKQWENILKRKSANYAKNMVNLLHFDYSSVSKSKLLRSPVGRFMFQFQHYAHKFLEYNLKVGREAGMDIMAGDIFSSDAAKAYRMGLVYMMVPALVSAATGLDAFRLVQHDTTSRLSQWWTFFTGDEEEIKQVTYGRGAIGALVGFPLLSDALTLGELLELYQLDDESYTALLAGYNDRKQLTGDQKFAQYVGLISPALKRYIYTTSDLAFSGNVGMALQMESNLYPNSEWKTRKEYLSEKMRDYSPDAVMDALDYIQEKREGGQRKSTSPKANVKNISYIGY